MKKNDNSEKKENNVSLFEKIFATVIGIVILTVIIISLLTSEPKFAITPITIALFVLLIVVAGMFVFDYISVGNVISLKKENEEIREENMQLRGIYNQNIVSNKSSLSVNINSADKDEINEKQQIEETSHQHESDKRPRMLSIDEKKNIKTKALDSYLSKYNMNSIIERDRVFSKNIEEIDPVMSRSRVFDAYYQDKDNEWFFDIVINNVFFGIYQYYLYIELSQIYHYNIKMGKKAKLLLLLPLLKINDIEVVKRREKNIEDLKRLFSPAIENGLLEVVPIDMTEIAI